jgi:hypothetical protein
MRYHSFKRITADEIEWVLNKMIPQNIFKVKNIKIFKKNFNHLVIVPGDYVDLYLKLRVSPK